MSTTQKCITSSLVCVVLTSLAGCTTADTKSQWKIGIQTASFRPNSLFQTIDRVQAVRVKYIALRDYKSLSDDQPKVPFNYQAPADVRETVKRKLDQAGIKLVNFYSSFLGDEAELRKRFVFAKDMGVQTMVGEPPADKIAVLDKLANEYQINVAIHNHVRNPKKPEYRHWNPDVVFNMIAGTSKRIGACPDIGHWVRSGVEPIDALKKLQGRIITVHLKDVEKYACDARGVPLGTGAANISGVLAELKRQGYSGYIIIEHEEGRPDNQEEVAQCVQYFR